MPSLSNNSEARYWRCASRFLLSGPDRDLLHSGQGAVIARRALAQIMSPFSTVNRELLQQDPFLILPNYVNALPVVGTRRPDANGFLSWSDGGRFFTLLQFRLAQDPFSNKSLAVFVPRLSALERALRLDYPGLIIKKAGAVFYGARGIDNAQTEAQLIGSISIVAIVMMCLLVFRGLRSILLTLIAVATGVLVGAAAVLLLFGKIHAVALVFGAGMIGVSVDYAFHYCVQRFATSDPGTADHPVEWLRHIFKPLSLGLVSTVIGFATLALSPFPGLQQIAVFAAGGLMASYLTVATAISVNSIDRKPRKTRRHIMTMATIDMEPINWASVWALSMPRAP